MRGLGKGFRLRAAALAGAVAPLSGAAAPAAAGAATPSSASPDPTAPAPLPAFGPLLDDGDSLAAYAARLGAVPSAVGIAVAYPVDDAGRAAVRDAAAEAARHRVRLVLTLAPARGLAAATDAEARGLGELLAGLREGAAAPILVRFAPEMNGTWTAWGQQPDAYAAAFRTLAAAVHGAGAETLWAPAYGAGYPFAGVRGAIEGISPDTVADLDTDGSGSVGPEDSPYAPYYPGDDAVDWVGLTAQHFGVFDTGTPPELTPNTVPEPGQFAAQLAGTFGYGTADGADRDFVGEFAAGRGKPLAVVTGALWAEGAPGAGEAEVKGAWLGQVAAAARATPALRLVLWQETERPEAEAQGRTGDWRLTHDAALAASLRSTMVGEAPDGAAPAFARGEWPASDAGLATTGAGDSGSRGETQQGLIPDWAWALATVLVLVAGVVAAQRPWQRRGSGGVRGAGRPSGR